MKNFKLASHCHFYNICVYNMCVCMNVDKCVNLFDDWLGDNIVIVYDVR